MIDYVNPLLFPIGIPINQYDMLKSLERLFGAPLDDVMERKYRSCQSIEDVFNLVCKDYFGLALRTDMIAEMFCCLCAGIEWTPRDGFDGHGSKLLGFEVAAARIQVRSSSNRNQEEWQFKTTDGTNERRYDILICVGYPLPFPYRYGNEKISTDHINPLQAKIFVMSVQDVANVGTIHIARNQYHAKSSARRANWWQHQVDYWDIEEVVTKLAHGVPPRFVPQLSLFGDSLK